MQSLISSATTIKVSSTLDKSVSKKNLVDGSPETCWTSTAGLPQFIELEFSEAITPTQLAFTFQGGFVGTKCVTYGIISEDSGIDKQWQRLIEAFPEDSNRRQLFTFPEPVLLIRLKIVFEESSDFFGRITLYNLELS